METLSPASAQHIAHAKLNPRLTSPRPVPRTQVVEHIHAAEEAGLVLVHGPAGFGKTTVMLQYFAQLKNRGIATGWLTLDSADNDLGRFLGYLVEVFKAVDPAHVLAFESRDGQAAADTDGAMVDLVNHLSAFRGRFVIFLDDFEVIESPVILGLLRQLIRYIPENGQFVIGSRTTPDLGLGRLRAHGRLLEVETAELRFTSQETAAFLRHQRGLALRDDHIARLQQRTEGWPAALWLVSLALRDRDDPQAFIDTFDGSNASIADYLLEDVLSRQTEQVRHFLLHTSVLHELSGPLCDYLLEGTDGHELLGQIERAHLFLVPQDEGRNWFRYHALFSGFLRNQLTQTAPHEAARLHRRAAQWWLAQNRPVRAIEHALKCDDAAYLLELLSAHASSLLWQGRARTLARWFAAARLGADLDRLPELALAFAWSLTLTHRYDESLQLLDRVERTHAGGSEVQGAVPPGAIGVQRAFVLAMTDHLKESSRLWLDCLAIVPPAQSFAHAMMGASYGYCLVAESRFDEARRFLDQARQQALGNGTSFITPMALCLEGAIDFAQGRLKSATASFRAALSGGGSTAMPHAASSTVSAAFLAEALYESDDLDEAEKLLSVYLPLLKDVAAPDQLITSHMVLVRIAVARGNPDRADELLGEMEITGHLHALPRMVATARLESARLALSRGNLESARDLLASAGDERTWAPFNGLVTHANDVDALRFAGFRLKIRSGQSEAVIAPLKEALKEAEGLRRHRRALKLNILLAEALCNAGQSAVGLRRLRDAIQFAATEGFFRSFVDEGHGVARYIAELRNARSGEAGEPGVHGPSDAASAFMDRVLGMAGVTAPGTVAAAAAMPTAAMGGPSVLSEREMQVLRLLAGGHRNRVIAEKLFVSETTVKAHLRSINVKLCTESRTHAIAVGRQMGLVA
ncbi:LuxR C-terminal-related transcriptional regulator [soil metagenome]